MCLFSNMFIKAVSNIEMRVSEGPLEDIVQLRTDSACILTAKNIVWYKRFMDPRQV